MLAVGNEELGKTIKEGDLITDGNVKVVVAFSYSDDGEFSIGTFTKGNESYVVSVNGQLLKGWKPVLTEM